MKEQEATLTNYEHFKKNTIQLKVRDFIYIDVDRLKSIISQIEEGFINDVHTKRIFKEGPFPNFLRETQESESKSLHDYLYNKVEEYFQKNEQFKIISDTLENKEAYIKQFRDNQSDTSFILLQGKVYINDFSQMRMFIEKWNDFGEFVTRCSIDPLKKDLSRKEFKKSFNELKSQYTLDEKLIEGFKLTIDLLYKNRVIIKIIPFKNHLDFRFVGNLNKNFLRDDISSITYKYGTAPVSKWTIFAQLASISPKDRSNLSSSIGGGQIEVALQKFFDSFRELEILAQSVIYPEIAITPIAIYRE